MRICSEFLGTCEFNTNGHSFALFICALHVFIIRKGSTLVIRFFHFKQVATIVNCSGSM